MKMQLFNLTMMIMMATALFAQKAPKRERVEAMKIAYITRELQLTPEEAQKFWPIYNAFNAEVESARNSAETPDLNSISDEEAKSILFEKLSSEQKVYQLKETYLKKYLEVLPAHKVLKLFVAERKFTRQLLKQLSKKRKGRPDKKRKNKFP